MTNAPDYINASLFKKALSRTNQDDFKISEEIDLKLISGKGDNFCSNIFRATFQVSKSSNGDVTETSTKTLVVKDLLKEVVSWGSKEYTMYADVLMSLDAILNTHQQADVVKLAPNCLLSTTEHGELYIFEDMNALGYKIADRWQGLTKQETCVVLNKLAQFHAASMVLVAKHPDVIDKVGDCYIKDDTSGMPQKVADGGIAAGSQYLKTQEGYGELAEKLLQNKPKFIEKLLSAVDPQPCRFKVINHGDLWLNNILFKSTALEVEDAVFLDYQLSFYGSPGVDLNFFLHTSVPLGLLQKHRYEFLRFYYKLFKSSLERLNYEPTLIPSFDDLVHEVRRTEYYSLFSTIGDLPLMCLNSELSKLISAFSFEDKELMKKVLSEFYTNERVKETLKFTLDRLNELGVLD